MCSLAFSEMPGIKQRRELAAAAIEQQGGGGGGDHNQLGEYLLSQYFWGVLSAPAVQTIAGKATTDGLNQPLLVKLASIGSNGQHLQNMHRDIDESCRGYLLGNFLVSCLSASESPQQSSGAQQVGHKDDPSTCVLLEALGGEEDIIFHSWLALAQNDGSLVKAFWKIYGRHSYVCCQTCSMGFQRPQFGQGHTFSSAWRWGDLLRMLAKATPKPWRCSQGVHYSPKSAQSRPHSSSA